MSKIPIIFGKAKSEGDDYLIGAPFYLTVRKGYKYGRYEFVEAEDGAGVE